MHYQQAMQAADAGRSIYVEKPVAFSREDAWRLEKAVFQRGLCMASGHKLLSHTPLWQHLMSLDLYEGVHNVRMYRTGRPRPDITPIWNLACHDVSIAMDLFGVPSHISMLESSDSREGLRLQCASSSGGMNTIEVYADVSGHRKIASFEADNSERGSLRYSWIGPSKDEPMPGEAWRGPLRAALAVWLAKVKTGVVEHDDPSFVIEVLEEAQPAKRLRTVA
jgi:predicted dehydrogenase